MSLETLNNGKGLTSGWRASLKNGLTLQAPMVTNINFLPTISIPCQEIRLWESVKWSLRENALIFYQILSTTSLKKCIEISLENCYVAIEAFFSCRHEKLSGMVWTVTERHKTRTSGSHISNIVPERLVVTITSKYLFPAQWVSALEPGTPRSCSFTSATILTYVYTAIGLAQSVERLTEER